MEKKDNTNMSKNIVKQTKQTKQTNLLNNTWIVWIHKIYDTNWLKESYKQLYSFNTIEEFWKFYKAIPDYSTNMYFLMREGVFPLWEDAKNRNGGTWSYIIEKDDINSHWIQMSAKMIGEIITNTNKHKNDINGISLSPRTNVAIIKIWNKTKSLENSISLNLDEPYSNALRYKVHKKNRKK
jgi:hypothetical protein|tara:strand:- start:178 stop:723 length:546 start_codon:yes stop_codon:yes gene_type:complete